MGPGINEPIIMIDVAASKYYYYHFDGLGSAIALSDENGDIVERYEYAPFGAVSIMSANYEPRTTSDYNNPYMFTGRRLDDETQLYYYRARMYHPELGRFMQPDPLGYYDSMNLYIYCLNNPLKWTDPYGLWTAEGHRNLGRYGRNRFDYARLDFDYSPIASYSNRQRHFRDINSAVRDAINAARRGDPRAFEYHVHEVQDWYSHRRRGYGPFWGHILRPKSPDDPTRLDNRVAYQQANIATERLEDIWDKYNPDYPDEDRYVRIQESYEKGKDPERIPSLNLPPYRGY